MTDTPIERAFEAGFRHGKSTGEHVSRRQVTERYPDWSDDQAETYLNGRDDGVAGDATRLFMMAAATMANIRAGLVYDVVKCAWVAPEDLTIKPRQQTGIRA